MSEPKPIAAPRYCKHRASGQAVVSIAGREHYLGKHGTDESRALYDQLVAEHLAAEGRKAAGGAAAVAEGMEPTLENLKRFGVNAKANLITRKNHGSSKHYRMAPAIEAEFEAVFRRPMELADINPDVCVMLMLRTKRKGGRQREMESRLAWFEERSKTAARLGWLAEEDFGDCRVYRKTDWVSNRALVPLPEIVPSKKGRGRPAKQSEEHEKQQMLLIDFFRQEYVPARLTGRSKQTIRQLTGRINAYSKGLGRPAIVADLNTETATNHLSWLLENTTLARPTIHKDRAVITALWNFAAKRGWLPTFPDLPKIQCPERVPEAWSDAQMVALMEAAKQAPGKVGRVDARLFWPALISVIYDTAERVTAMMGIEHRDITGEWLTIRAELRKGKTRDRQHKLRPITLERIAAIKVFGQAKVFEWPYVDSYLWPLFRKILQAAGLPHGRRDLFHRIRRTAASNFEAAGGNATSLLDHFDRRTTRAYLDPRVVKTPQAVDLTRGIGEAAAIALPQTPDTELLAKLREMLSPSEKTGL